MVRYSEPPFVLGYDVCGVVVDSKHVDTPVGTKLFGRVRDGDMGTAAQFVAVRPEFLCVQPAGLDDDQAACVGLAGQTAFQMIKAVGGSKENKSVLVLGGAGGVGHLAIQLCRILGFTEVVSTASTAKVDFVKSLGATLVIDYKKQSVHDVVKAGSIDCIIAMLLPCCAA
jgi:NADPH:quinone reductase-like Zn-dependent oxidoreductase